MLPCHGSEMIMIRKTLFCRRFQTLGNPIPAKNTILSPLQRRRAFVVFRVAPTSPTPFRSK